MTCEADRAEMVGWVVDLTDLDGIIVPRSVL